MKEKNKARGMEERTWKGWSMKALRKCRLNKSQNRGLCYLFFLVLAIFTMLHNIFFFYLFAFGCARSSWLTWLSLVVASRATLAVVRGLLSAAASLAAHRLQIRAQQMCDAQAYLLCNIWSLSRPGMEPVTPALTGGLSTTGPPGFLHCFLFVSTPGPSAP